MTDYTSEGAVPVEDAAVPNPPTVDELLEKQRQEHPEQFRSEDRSDVPVDAPVDGDNGGA